MILDHVPLDQEKSPWSESIKLTPEPNTGSTVWPRLPSWAVFESIWTPSWRDPPMPCLIDAWSWYEEESRLTRLW
jgi:hypothetical protein